MTAQLLTDEHEHEPRTRCACIIALYHGATYDRNRCCDSLRSCNSTLVLKHHLSEQTKSHDMSSAGVSLTGAYLGAKMMSCGNYRLSLQGANAVRPHAKLQTAAADVPGHEVLAV